ncbi:phosphonate metabolism protein/1,5-bisphosphokinase (PRPP-forming) PhnN [Pseudooceanicola onchidii]|uniref:phosphonate metabolism protein/1,5-bisphosphokinase (PRPP-forming) PhnN n=1 Tax=Pseudooceanicola onchidii TaxID=2562279 RepID=UPI0010AB2406|nr:phosphonate metabolism protein/1,5-bisphosphokinase (PRPP-forming) PhnN [Pseudooceanicola onchidii]
MTPVRLIGVVGPSGVGKDTVMQAVAARWPGLHLVRRVITRPSDAGGEDFDGVTQDDFDARADRGEFLLHWQAHGLRYGIPRGIEDRLAQGGTAMVNLSRAVLVQAQDRVPGFAVLSLTAAPAVLATRLAARGREDRDEIRRRLDRADYALPQGLTRVVTIDNSGPLEDTVTAVLSAFRSREEVET